MEQYPRDMVSVTRIDGEWPLCDGWHKMLTSLASCADRHKAGPGNIMQPPGTKV
eukprot:COSAG02_NODE_1684_length_11324_cov_8.190111_1_plen_53_part_10